MVLNYNSIEETDQGLYLKKYSRRNRSFIDTQITNFRTRVINPATAKNPGWIEIASSTGITRITQYTYDTFKDYSLFREFIKAVHSSFRFFGKEEDYRYFKNFVFRSRHKI